MWKLTKFIIAALTLISINAFAYDNKVTHPGLTQKAVINPEFQDFIVDNLGLPGGTKTRINGSPILQWLKEGSLLEDEPNCRASNHFHNPLDPWSDSYMSDQPGIINWWCSRGESPEYPAENIKSNVTWATGFNAPGQKDSTNNQWDWDHARKYYHIYLTGQDFEGNLVASTQKEKDTYFSMGLRAVGQVMHLLQDMAVPAHVRNDFKSHLDWKGITLQSFFTPTEWVNERYEYIVKKNYKDLTSSLTTFDVNVADLHNGQLTDLWDTDIYNGQDPDTIDLSLVGLAEFTNSNFVSYNTIFTEDTDPASDHYHPYPRETSTDISDYINYSLLPKIVRGEDSVPDTRFYISKAHHGVKIDHFLAPTYFTRDIQRNDDVDFRLFFKTLKIDDECAKEYAGILLPRAIGYSTALLDYFFRGSIEITAPEAYLYSIIDGSVEPQRFTHIKAKLRNITPKEVDPVSGDVLTYEDIKAGTLQAVARYKKRTDYQPDLSADPPIATSRQDQFSYSVSAPIEIASLSSTDPVEYEFDFAANPIPAGITDLYLHIVFKGTLGDETNNAIAVGMKDLNEPMHICIWNSTDRLYSIWTTS